ncbi:MAG: tRNA dihydrouridine synthase DusB [Planctomycetes bacterium]|nr:tRNA dihydrouridine synthase DusB [Planctomycetota bacterium]MCC7170401.1 tRNA dihydrouridine synthase DusB [Planctomycetota bacterium]
MLPTQSGHIRSAINLDVQNARPGEFAPLRIGPLVVDPPVVLAPMAGVTNSAFRRICRRFGAGLYVSEMITARGLLEKNRKTWTLASFAPGEWPRSIQLYGSDPDRLREAARVLAAEGHVDHIDMNFGCPVRKVTAAGGGSAIPARPKLMAKLVRALVEGAGHVPVTIKFRKGIDDRTLTFIRAGRIAAEEGCKAVGLHARTAAQSYSGDADWNAIGELKAAVPEIPVLGNGDVWEAHDALRMMRQTGCDGVIIGRGCLGRPWLFRDLVDVFAGREPQEPPRLGEITKILREHAVLLCEVFGEFLGVSHMRRHGAWYTKGFPGTSEFRLKLNLANTMAEVDALLATLDPDAPFPPAAARIKRAKSGGAQKVSLPPRWLEDAEQDACVVGEDAEDDGGDGG